MMTTNPHMERLIARQNVSMQESILRQRMMTDAIITYGLTLSAIAAVCAIALYIYL
jgi:hypothetical protein